MVNPFYIAHNILVGIKKEDAMLECIGNSIFENRKKKGLTQEQLAETMGISAVAISKWERGVCLPELSMVCQMADYFQISVDELLGRKIHLLEEEEKYSDSSFKQLDYNVRKNLIHRYENKECTVGLLEGLSELEDNTIQKILKELNNTTLIYALAGASGKVCKRVMENLSGRMLCFVDDKLQKEKFEVGKIEVAQNAVLQILQVV